MSVLAARGITVAYGGVHALSDVDLTVEAGELVGLIGPNGAGKTTFVDAVTGFTPHGGTVHLDGRDLTGAPPHACARAGLSRTWQSGELFDDLSVGENLAVAADRKGWWTTIARSAGRPGAVPRGGADVLARVGLDDAIDAAPTDLSQGQRKLVGVARALAAGPRLVCLDEPAAGLDTGESRQLGRRLRAVVDGGTAMLLIDHDMGLVMSVCDRVVVLEFGEVIAVGRPEQIRSDPAVVTAYLGTSPPQVPAAPVTGPVTR
jgi:branched-chain amino acid transport system ATP-binding protein